MKVKWLLGFLIINILIFLTVGCRRGDSGSDSGSNSGGDDLSATKTISAFSFIASDNDALTIDVTSDINGTDITVTIPFEANVFLSHVECP